MDKLLQLLGLAMRAGKIVSGEEQVLHKVRSKEAKLVLLAKDAAINTEKQIQDKCHSYGIPVVRYGTKEKLGKAIGKHERVVIAVMDTGFTQAIRKLIE